MTSVLKAPSLPSPPKKFSAIQIHRHRNYCRIWESPEPIITSQQNVCHLQHSDVTQMNVDPKEVSIGTVLQNLPCGAPTSISTTPPLPVEPLPISNVNDQRSISPILGTNTRKNPRIVSTSPLKISQTSSSTPQLSLPSPSIPLPPSTTPLSEDDVHFYASPCPSQSPAHLQMNISSLTGSVPGAYTSGDENNDTYMEDNDENPFIIPTEKVPPHPTPLLLRRPSLTHNPALTIDGLSSGSRQVSETAALREATSSSKHTTTRCQPKHTIFNCLETGSSGDEKPVLSSPTISDERQRYNPIFTGDFQVQTNETHGHLRNVDQTKSELQSTPTQSKHVTYYGDAYYSMDIDMNELPEHNAANHSPPQTDYTTIKREPSIIDLTEDPTELESKPHVLHDAIHPTSSTVIISHKEDHTEPSHTVLRQTAVKTSTKPPAKRQNSSIKSQTKSKSKHDEEKLPTIEHEGDTKYFCSICNCTLNRSSDYRRHSWSNRHRAACNEPKITYECPYCQEILCRSDALTRHMTRSCRKRYSNTSTSEST